MSDLYNARVLVYMSVILCLLTAIATGYIVVKYHTDPPSHFFLWILCSSAWATFPEVVWPF
jgi:hypothetical protein